MALRLAFMGTPDFAVPSLQALLEAGHEVVAVYSQPPRPAGRGKKPRLSPVQQTGEAAGLLCRHPLSLKDAEEQEAFQALGVEAAVVVAYGLLLPPAILEAPRLGCFNVHASLLPRWRGAAPIQRAIEAGDAESGVSIMKMDEGLDTGAVVARAALPLTAETTGESLHDALAVLGAQLMAETLPQLAAGAVTLEPQSSEGVTYAAKLHRAEAALDWTQPAVVLERKIRAFTPWPGAFALLPTEGAPLHLKIQGAEVVPNMSGPPGKLLDSAFTVACGEDALRLTRVQRPGKSVMAAADFLRGYALPAGAELSLPEKEAVS